MPLVATSALFHFLFILLDVSCGWIVDLLGQGGQSYRRIEETCSYLMQNGIRTNRAEHYSTNGWGGLHTV